MILALDLATKCGYALGDGAKRKAKYGTMDFHNAKFDGAGARFVKFGSWLTNTIVDNNVSLVVYEGVRSHSAVDAAHVYGGWLAILQSVCEELNVPYTAFGVTEIKKHWTGKGNANKEKMIQTARDLGYDPPDDNAADALAVYHMALDQYSIV